MYRIHAVSPLVKGERRCHHRGDSGISSKSLHDSNTKQSLDPHQRGEGQGHTAQGREARGASLRSDCLNWALRTGVQQRRASRKWGEMNGMFQDL